MVSYRMFNIEAGTMLLLDVVSALAETGHALWRRKVKYSSVQGDGGDDATLADMSSHHSGDDEATLVGSEYSNSISSSTRKTWISRHGFFRRLFKLRR